MSSVYLRHSDAAFMPSVSHFRDLRVYRLARAQADLLFRVTSSFPADERFALTAQIRRSSSSVPSLIAEAWPRRRYKKAFVNSLRIALGEVHETQAWLDHARQRGYLSEEKFAQMDDAWEHVAAMLYKMVGMADQFAGR